MKVKTKDLLLALKLLTSVIKPNKLKPVTELIEFKDSYLYMTDNISSMSYKINCEGEMPSFVINATKVKDLLNLTTKEYVEFVYKDDYVLMKADGRYKLAIVADNNNPLSLNIVFPVVTDYNSIDVSRYSVLMERCKYSFLSSSAQDLFRYYFYDGKALATNSENISVVNNIPMIESELYPMIIEDLAKFNCELNYVISNKGYYFFNDSIQYLTLRTKQGQFPSETVSNIADLPCPSNCLRICKNNLQSALRRLQTADSNIFDTPIFLLTLSTDGVKILSEKGLAEEVLECDYAGTCCTIVLTIEGVLKLLRLCKSQVTISFDTSMLFIEDDEGRYIVSAINPEED